MIREVAMYTVDCDRCGRNADEGTNYSAWVSADDAFCSATADADFWSDEDGKHYCSGCHHYCDELNDGDPVPGPLPECAACGKAKP